MAEQQERQLNHIECIFCSTFMPFIYQKSFSKSYLQKYVEEGYD